MSTIQVINLIAIDSAVRSGHPHIVGTTITVADVAIARIYHAMDADGIAEWYGLSLPQVYAALTYYYEHKDELDQQIRKQIRQAEALKEQRIGGKDSLLSR